MDNDRCPGVLTTALAIHICFNAAIMQYALENWPSFDASLRLNRNSGPYYYNEDIYRSLGL